MTKRSGTGTAKLATGKAPLHRAIYQQLLEEIRSGLFRTGDRLPSEAVLCARFGASRITVAKAIQGLQAEGLVSRRAGSGTFVQLPAATDSLKFGLLIPELGSTEIFEPICRGMMSSHHGKSHTLVWGNAASTEADAEAAAVELCRQFIAQRVDGIFFAPLEYAPARDQVNCRIVSDIERAGIPTILLDRAFKPYPEASRFDLVGIDNHRAGFVLTQHLLALGRRRIAFATRPASASTVTARVDGYRRALFGAGLAYPGVLLEGDLTDPEGVRDMLRLHRPDAFVCANDLAAARLMRSLLSLGVRIPDDIAIVGVDNVHYAQLLPVPLTTIEQNCREIGAAAISLMLDRIESPQASGRNLLVDFRLIVRESCGPGVGPPL